MMSQQRADMLIEPVGGTKKQITLQVKTVNFLAVRHEQCEVMA